MLITPKCRGFICTTAHPEGCRANVREQIDFVKSQPRHTACRRALILGASTGYGLASRIAAAYGSGADTVGVYFEKPPTAARPATAGWYNARAFDEFARADGLTARSFNADAYADETRATVIDALKSLGGEVDMVIYSLASPKRQHPHDGVLYGSVIKPIGAPYTGRTVDFHTGTVSDVTVSPATEDEIAGTVKVMGGEDWLFWMRALSEAGLLAQGVRTLAYSYIGPSVTHPIYADGTIGRAKHDLEERAREITGLLSPLGGHAYVSVNKALVTQASSAIPVVPLYISLLYKVMREAGLHEGCIEQMERLFRAKLDAPTDSEGRIRMDDLEMREEIQSAVMDAWDKVNSENVYELSDLTLYRKEFYKLFGFERDDVDYTKEVETL